MWKSSSKLNGQNPRVSGGDALKSTESDGTKLHTLVFNEVFPDDHGPYRVVITDGKSDLECEANLTGKKLQITQKSIKIFNSRQ